MRTGKLILLVSVFFLLNACRKSSPEDFDSDFSLFRDYVTSFSSGMISANSDIQVGLAFSKAEWKPNQELDEDIFDISPSVDGKVVVLPNNILAFQPKKKLKQGEQYQVTLHLDKLIEVPKELSDFNFTVKTIEQDFKVEVQDLQSYTKDTQFLNMILKSADNMDLATAKKLVSATQNGKELPIKFNEKGSSPTEFSFVIDQIQRGEDDSKVLIKWDGDPADINQKGEKEFTIPGKNNFTIVDVRIGDENNQSVRINFSDPLKKDQNFSGLVALETVGNLRYAVDGNVLKAFSDVALDGKLLLEVFQGIENTDGYKMKKGYAAKITFEQIKPEVRFVKSGTILPSSHNLKVNFEAANLKKVDVKVYRIFENNVLQFLQDNELNGNYDLRKVALPIAKKTLELTTNKLANYKKWNSYSLDLSTLIKPEQGAIYRVEFTIKRSYSLYTCDTPAEEEPVAEEDEEPEDFSSYDSFDYDYYDYDYNWNERDNPCHKSYYSNNKVATNILATDLGVIVKRGENGSYFFAVNNIVTTEPVSGATVELYNYQKQKLVSETTDGDGIVNFSTDKKAFFAIIKKDKNTTYVKLDDGNSQSVSNFNVDGEALQKGLKGFIYGERGVWRPGDTIYLSFILNDKSSRLPNTHPIKLKLSDPNGKVVYQKVQKYTDKNHYKFAFKTQPNAPTGNYEAVVSVGGARFYKAVKIETIKPNRLKIKNGFDGKMLSAFHKNDARVDVAWLHGAVAKDLKLEMQAKFTQQKTTFKNYSKYVFDDPARKFSTEEVNIYSGKIDETGKANVSIQPRLQSQAPGMLKASFITKVYENGGDFSTDVISATYSPFQTYVGVKTPEPNKYGMLETGKSNAFDVVTVDENGRPKAVRNLEVRVYKVDWRWWWDASDDLSNYSSSTTNTPFYSQVLNTDGSGKARFQFKTTDDEWGRYLVRVTDPNGGHSSGETVMIDWPIWSGKTRNTNGAEAKMLVFSADKEKYNVGEKAIVSFPSSEGGRALISLESGAQVVQTLWAESKKGETQVEIPITSKMAPNVYIHITLLQPHASTKNDSPIRLYGIIPIEVVDKNTVLEPQIAMPEVLKPEQKTTIKVSEKNGKAMTYTIAIVDEGLLDLTRFKTPNAWNSFYSREALGVKTWDIYDEVIGAYGGKVNQIFSIGGDEDLGGGQAKKANRFKPVVIYLGPYSLSKGQTKSHEIKLPKYVGSVRTMVVAGDAQTSAYGSVEKTTPVRNPLMILASLPRKVSPGEKVTLPVTVFAMEKHVKNVTLQLKTNNGFRVIGNSKQTLSFAQPDEKIAYFDLNVGDLTGIGKVTVVATSGKEKASFDVELDILNPNPVTQDYKELILEPNSSGTINWDAFGVAGTNTAKLEVSAFPSMDFNKRLDYLIQYPHGCLEQTTSSVFPQLYLGDIADLDTARKSKIQKNITAGIQKLAQFQLANGGFAYWQGNQTPDDWSTTYVGHFLIEAERKGYALPANLKKQWLAYQSKTAKQWRYNEGYRNDFAQSYRLYVLALAGNPDLSSMNRLRETSGITNDTKLRLAATYALAGQKNVGMTLLGQSKIDEDSMYGYYYYYGSSERNRAMALETLLLLGRKTEAFTMATKLAKEMSSNRWMSTQTTAYCLYAMSKFAQQNGTKGIDVSFTSRGKSETIKTAKAFADRTLQVSGVGNTVTVKNNKNTTLYIKVITSGILPIGQEQTEQRGLSTDITFRDRKGNAINVASLAQGTEFVAEVTVSNTKGETVENVALTQIIPSGWEIVNTRFTDYGSFADNKVDYTDIRDDRTNFYFTLKSNETKTFRILLNASYLGKYYLPGVQCEAMYDNSYYARTQGQWVNVVK
ncbi:alpha-2-macroglobulin family protein [Flavobacterium lindanitolerans]|uniref:alpha-2-macroglobulin family protein n=1 Tax=Flavobacterium lindanitolerans TaxID=428988 RepID=UPI0027B90385|nr:MG2 domain-containing protein [Flavobacterium lindanitolerans]